MQSNNEVEYLNTKIAGINERRDKLTQDYSQLQRVLEHTEVELAKVMSVNIPFSILITFPFSFFNFN